jgi:hypothetical protein
LTWFLVGQTEAEARARGRYFEGKPPTFAGMMGTPAQIIAKLRE